MKQEYVDWISANVAGNGYGECAEVTLKMVEAFPNLRRVRGHYYCFGWGERAHWWLVDVDGSIVDPTAAQFPSGGNGEYVEWDESRPEPTGICANCGEQVFDGNTCCSESCHNAYARFCMG